MEISLWIDGKPVPWKSHGGYGKYSYNPRSFEKKEYQKCIKSQFAGDLIEDAVKIDVTFYFFSPKKTKKLEKNIHIYHTKRPDVTNLYKFLEDCLKGIIIKDDSQVVQANIRKIYSDWQSTEVQIKTLP